ncbi:response regulator transcription factor [Haloferula sp.]|uniref:response regulator transcription factor n=1 Tax=Haloferula sp. TaxID=2497595 RepID=UPI003C7070A2
MEPAESNGRNPSDPAERPVIYLVDDDVSLLRALGRRLRAAGFEVEAFDSARDFLDHHCSERVACAVVDLQMPDLSGFAVQEWLAAKDEALPIVFLTAHGDIPSSVRAMKGGAVDFLTKPVRGEELIDAINRALALVDEERETRSLTRMWRERYASLTPCESRVFALIVKGLPNKGIATETGVCERTVKAHRAEVMRKLCVQSPAELGRAVEWIGEKFVPSPS